MEKLFNGFYNNKTVLITGHTGFKGSWLSLILKLLHANIIGYSLKPLTEKDNFVLSGLDNKITSIIADVRDYHKLLKVFNIYKPEIVFHLAAQPIVRLSYAKPKETFDINIGGTVNFLECSRKIESVKVIVIITSDKCYKNKERRVYRESDEMGGDDPYSASKGCAELITNSYLKSYDLKNKAKALSSVRAGNVIGGGDWQKDRLVPDCIKSLEKGEALYLRNSEYIRPWQHVLEPLLGYLLLGYRMFYEPEKYAGAWNFGPAYKTSVGVKELATMIMKEWGEGEIIESKKPPQPYEAPFLCLDCTKVESLLKWQPLLTLKQAVRLTVEWYKKYKTHDVFELCNTQIKFYSDRFQSIIKM